jgi:hypothetical protein
VPCVSLHALYKRVDGGAVSGGFVGHGGIKGAIAPTVKGVSYPCVILWWVYFHPMLIDDVRTRIHERLRALGVTPTTKAIKDRLVEFGLSEKYLDQMLVSRKAEKLPIEPTLSKLEAIARALDVSLPWLVFGIGRPESMFAPKAEATPVYGIHAARAAKAKIPAQTMKARQQKK